MPKYQYSEWRSRRDVDANERPLGGLRIHAESSKRLPDCIDDYETLINDNRNLEAAPVKHRGVDPERRDAVGF